MMLQTYAEKIRQWFWLREYEAEKELAYADEVLKIAVNTANPWSKDGWSLHRQAILIKHFPFTAKSLKRKADGCRAC